MIYSSAPEDSFVLTRILEAGGLEPARVSFIMLTEAMTELARAGVGVGVLPRWSAQRAIAAGTVRALSIGRRGVHRQWTAATLAAREEPDYLAAFIDLVAERAGPTRLASHGHERPPEPPGDEDSSSFERKRFVGVIAACGASAAAWSSKISATHGGPYGRDPFARHGRFADLGADDRRQRGNLLAGRYRPAQPAAVSRPLPPRRPSTGHVAMTSRNPSPFRTTSTSRRQLARSRRSCRRSNGAPT